MKKIAIITSKSIIADYDSGYSDIVTSISDWSEVSDEDYQLLRSWCGKNNSYSLLCREDVCENFIPRLVSEFTILAKAEKNQEEQEKIKREEAKQQRELKKRAKTEQAERKLLEALKQKFEA